MNKLRYYFALLLSLGLALGPISTANAGLESATYVSDLNTANPTAGDPVAQGDDHVRLIKSALKTTFPEASAPIYGHRSATAQAWTSGTTVDFTSIPSWVKRITISFSGVSTNGTSTPMVQLGDSGGIEATGYLGAVFSSNATPTINIANHNTGFLLSQGHLASVVYHGTVTLTLLDAATFTWVCTINLSASSSAFVVTGSGTKALSATLDRVRVTTVGGTDAGDAGSINIQYD